MTSIERSVSALVGVLAIAACKEAAAPRPTTSSVPSVVMETPKEDGGVVVEGGSPLRHVDWTNHDYGGFAALQYGHAESHLYGPNGGAHDTFETSFVAVAYGDLDGDGTEEAVVVLKHSIWIAATHRESTHGSVHVFTWRDGAAASIATEAMIGPPSALLIDRGTTLVYAADGEWTCVLQRPARQSSSPFSAVALRCVQ